MNPPEPCAPKPHPMTGLTHAGLGMRLFLASETMLFGGLFSGWLFLKINAQNWPGHLGRTHLVFGILGTLFLIFSHGMSLRAAARSGGLSVSGVPFRLGLALMLALLFVITKIFDWRDQWLSLHYPKTHTYFAVYYAITGVHLLHVLAGMAALAWFIGAYVRRGPLHRESLENRLRSFNLYWSFVHVIWWVIFMVFYCF